MNRCSVCDARLIPLTDKNEETVWICSSENECEIVPDLDIDDGTRQYWLRHSEFAAPNDRRV